jgi:hypothetical protein
VDHRRASAVLVAALTSGFVISGRAQGPVGDVIVPLGVYRPPVVFVVGSADAQEGPLAEALTANGIASLRQTASDRDPIAQDPAPGGDALVRDVVARLTALRNDARFPTVSVIGRGAGAPTAAIAARLARADGFVSIAPQGAAADIARLVVPVLEAPDGERGAKAIAEFVRGVPPLGRSGTREQRPTTPRLSPRAVALATIGGALVGIEHGRADMTLTRRTDRAEGLKFVLDPGETGGLLLKLVWDDREYSVPIAARPR